MYIHVVVVVVVVVVCDHVVIACGVIMWLYLKDSLDSYYQYNDYKLRVCIFKYVCVSGGDGDGDGV